MPVLAIASAFVCWFAGFVGYFGAIANTTGRKPAIELFFNALQLCVSANFTETGLAWRRLHFAGMLGFVASMFVACATAP